MILELSKIKKAEDNSQYEEFCNKLITLIFENDLSSKTSFGKNKNREFDYGDGIGKSERDIYIPLVINKTAQETGFWEHLAKKPEDHLYGRNCRRIVFECKNNVAEIEDKYIYQIFRYLDPGDPVRDNFGKFGVILCRTLNLSRNAKEALIRIKKEGYTIVFLEDKDIIEMFLPEYIKEGSVAKFFENSFNLFDTRFPDKLIKS